MTMQKLPLQLYVDFNMDKPKIQLNTVEDDFFHCYYFGPAIHNFRPL